MSRRFTPYLSAKKSGKVKLATHWRFVLDSSREFFSIENVAASTPPHVTVANAAFVLTNKSTSVEGNMTRAAI